MKRFAILFNQMPGKRLHMIPFLVNEFDWIQFNIEEIDLGELNKYEAIYMYIISGANKQLLGEVNPASTMPIYLRKNGVTEPKFLWQMDYYQLDHYEEFVYRAIGPYIDIMLDCSYVWRYNEILRDINHHYVAYPLKVTCEKSYELKEKENYAIILNRHYGHPHPSMEVAENVGLNPVVLGLNHDKVYKEEFCEIVAKARVALDYHTKGMTWSRFGAECSLLGTPILGPPEFYSISVANKDLAIPYNILNVSAKVRKLIGNPDYYSYCQDYARNNIKEHLDPEVCEERYKSAMRLIGIDV